MPRTKLNTSENRTGAGPKPFVRQRILDNLARIAEWAKDGYTLQQIADGLKIHVATLCDYKNRLPELDDALKTGREIADMRVQNSLYRRAIGYTATEETTVERNTPEGVITETKRIKKHIAPDVTAQIFWLKNRKPNEWRDKQEVQHTGTIRINIDEVDAEL